MANKLLIPVDEIEKTTKKALIRHGASPEIAALVAHAVRTADMAICVLPDDTEGRS